MSALPLTRSIEARLCQRLSAMKQQCKELCKPINSSLGGAAETGRMTRTQQHSSSGQDDYIDAGRKRDADAIRCRSLLLFIFYTFRFGKLDLPERLLSTLTIDQNRSAGRFEADCFTLRLGRQGQHRNGLLTGR